MEVILEGLFARPWMSIGAAAFLSGVALYYLVMQRTRKHRMNRYDSPES